MTRHARAEITSLFRESRQALRLSQKALADKLGASERTGQRWAAGVTVPSQRQLVVLVSLLAPVRVDLAKRAAAAAGVTLEMPPPPAPAKTTPSPAVAAAVLCAAAEAIDSSPRLARRALAAAVAAARALGARVDDLSWETPQTP